MDARMLAWALLTLCASLCACTSTTPTDASIDGAATDSADAAPSDDGGHGRDVAPATCGATLGECGVPGQTCVRCPGSMPERYLCTTVCTSDPDCGNRDLPMCFLAPGMVGICVPAAGC